MLWLKFLFGDRDVSELSNLNGITNIKKQTNKKHHGKCFLKQFATENKTMCGETRI
jgi:hypothetical protein